MSYARIMGEHGAFCLCSLTTVVVKNTSNYRSSIIRGENTLNIGMLDEAPYEVPNEVLYEVSNEVPFAYQQMS